MSVKLNKKIWGMHLTPVILERSLQRMREDYPRTLLEFEERFSTESGCIAYLRQLRWHEGFICPRCNSAGITG